VGVALLVAAAVVSANAPAAWSDDFVVIRNAKNPITSITPAQAKEMAIGKRKVWPHGAVVGLVLTQVGSAELGWFASKVCGVADAALMAKIKQEVFKGELRKPVIVGSSGDVVAGVAADEGALGIVRADAVRNGAPGVAILSLK
jgi:hypothetical protein